MQKNPNNSNSTPNSAIINLSKTNNRGEYDNESNHQHNRFVVVDTEQVHFEEASSIPATITAFTATTSTNVNANTNANVNRSTDRAYLACSVAHLPNPVPHPSWTPGSVG